MAVVRISVTARGLASSCTSPSGGYPRLKSGVVFATRPLVATGCVPVPVSLTMADVITDPTIDLLGFNARTKLDRRRLRGRH